MYLLSNNNDRLERHSQIALTEVDFALHRFAAHVMMKKKEVQCFINFMAVHFTNADTEKDLWLSQYDPRKLGGNEKGCSGIDGKRSSRKENDLSVTSKITYHS